MEADTLTTGWASLHPD